MDIIAWIHELITKVFRRRESELRRRKRLSKEGKKLREELKKMYERPEAP